MPPQAPDVYREKALEARRHAHKAPMPTLRATFLELAAVYDSLAVQVETLAEQRRALAAETIRRPAGR
jgi:hypothetical protein